MNMKVRDLNLQDNNELRLQLFLARCGVASRRASEAIILDGRVTVNGEKITALGTKVTEKDTVCVDGKQVTLEETKRYVLLNKPKGYVCSSADEKDRETAVDLLKTHFSERLYNVGRLDMFSEGLIIFTNDGEFMRKLSHPSSQVEKEYFVETTRPIPQELIDKFQSGIRVENIFYKAKKAELTSRNKAKFVLIEGKNREIRKVFEKYEIGIKVLKRVRIGHIELGTMQSGEFRELTESDVKKIFS